MNSEFMHQTERQSTFREYSNVYNKDKTAQQRGSSCYNDYTALTFHFRHSHETENAAENSVV